MNIYRYILSLFCVLAILIVTGCDGNPVFTEMSTNRLKIVIKGTLESETPADWDSVFNPLIDNPTTSGYVDDSVDDQDDITSDRFPDKFMFDIAEIRLDGEEIGKYRQVFDVDLDDSEPFFDGSGITLKNDDPADGTYNNVQIYVRKMIFDNARLYTSTGTGFEFENLAEVIFHEDEVNGFNFGLLQINSYWDSLRDNASDIIRIYPIRVPIIGGLKYDKSNEETILEIRIVIKNFIKMYEYDYYEDGIFKVCHFYGLSDWLRDVREDENAMGRNIIAVARAYVKGKTREVRVTAASGNYVIALPSTEDLSDYYLTDNGVTLRNNVGWCDLPRAPVFSGLHIESVLEYYLNYEAYKNVWNTAVSGHTADPAASFAAYEAAWDTYEGLVNTYKIAPYVAVSSGGIATFSNMAPGSYNFYEVTTTPGYGALFLDSDIDPDPINGGTPVPITAGDTFVTVP